MQPTSSSGNENIAWVYLKTNKTETKLRSQPSPPQSLQSPFTSLELLHLHVSSRMGRLRFQY